MEAECLVELARVTGPLVHWITGPTFGLSCLVIGIVGTRLWCSGQVEDNARQMKEHFVEVLRARQL